MEPRGSLPYTQGPTTGLYPEPQASKHNFPLYCVRSILILSSHPRIDLPFTFGFSDQNFVRISHLPCVLLGPILLDLIILITVKRRIIAGTS